MQTGQDIPQICQWRDCKEGILQLQQQMKISWAQLEQFRNQMQQMQSQMSMVLYYVQCMIDGEKMPSSNLTKLNKAQILFPDYGPGNALQHNLFKCNNGIMQGPQSDDTDYNMPDFAKQANQPCNADYVLQTQHMLGMPQLNPNQWQPQQLPYISNNWQWCNSQIFPPHNVTDKSDAKTNMQPRKIAKRSCDKMGFDTTDDLYFQYNTSENTQNQEEVK